MLNNQRSFKPFCEIGSETLIDITVSNMVLLLNLLLEYVFPDGLNINAYSYFSLAVLRGKVMREVGVEIVGQGALKLTGFLRELLQRRNISFESLYTVRTIKEVCALICTAISNCLRPSMHSPAWPQRTPH